MCVYDEVGVSFLYNSGGHVTLLKRDAQNVVGSSREKEKQKLCMWKGTHKLKSHYK